MEVVTLVRAYEDNVAQGSWPSESGDRIASDRSFSKTIRPICPAKGLSRQEHIKAESAVCACSSSRGFKR